MLANFIVRTCCNLNIFSGFMKTSFALKKEKGTLVLLIIITLMSVGALKVEAQAAGKQLARDEGT